MKPTVPIMSDVARLAGVSRITVSRVYREPDSVSEKTRRKVEAAAAAINFVPDRMAGALRSGVSNIVAAIVPSLRNSTFVETLHGLSFGLLKRGLVLSVGDSGFSQTQEYHVATEMMSLKLRGLVLVATEHNRDMQRLIKQARFPVVEVGDLVNRRSGLVVSFSNKEAARAMTRHLISRGYRRIAFATLPLKESERARIRYEGYREALLEAGIAFDQQLVIEAEGGHRSGAATLAKFLDSGISVDAYFGAGDVFALSALMEARRRGMSIPRDLAIASFDDHDICQIADPRLTSIRIPRYEIGTRTAEIIADTKMSDPLGGKKRVDVGFQLMIREST